MPNTHRADPIADAGPHLLRVLRRRAGMSQEELADRSGVSERTIRSMEAGRTSRPRGDTLQALATALGLDDGTREQFRACWRAGERSLRLTDLLALGVAELETEVQRLNSARSRRVVYDVLRIGSDRRLDDVTTREVIEPVREGLDRLILLCSARSDQLDPEKVRATGVHGVELSEGVTLPEVDGRVFEARFGASLPVGEPYAMEWRVDYRSAYPSSDDGEPQPDTDYAVGLLTPIDSLGVEVRFCAGILPRRIRQVTRARLDSDEDWTEVRPMTVNALGNALLWSSHPEPGVHGIEWEW